MKNKPGRFVRTDNNSVVYVAIYIVVAIIILFITWIVFQNNIVENFMALILIFALSILIQKQKVNSMNHMNEKMINAVNQEYIMIGLVNMSDYSITKLKGNYSLLGIKDENLNFREFMEKYIEEKVNSAYKESFWSAIQPLGVMDKINHGHTIISSLYKNYNDEWIMMDITKSKDYTNDNPEVLITFKSASDIIQQQTEKHQRDEMLMHFSREYFEVYVVDLKKGSYEIIRTAERYGNYIKSLTGDFVQLMEMAIASWPKPPYRDVFKQLMDMEGLKEQFSHGQNKIEFIYESYDEKWKSF